MVVTLLVWLAVAVSMIVVMAVAVACQPPHQKPKAGQDKYTAGDMPLLDIDLALELEANHRDHAAQHY
jgi:hypothetical protein